MKSEKTAITHIDEGFVFLGQRIVRRPKGHKRYVYTFVSNEALALRAGKIKALTTSTGAAMCTSRTPPQSG